ncbi:hypothetical protein AX660_15310 [Paraglaciecola hydrolytica]|uniref:Uncharacterized protein n=2 Tax=Paraglaciecola hydrolytica TaxID=1799789 RepID=A0A135ZZQ9_9ALTE|nr:hypothetical protein AX660_15310 [Paraglaciecola hydrolytica]
MQMPVGHAKELPPILDYYPGCDYQVIGLLEEKGVVSMAQIQDYVDREYEQDLAKILTKLQSSAAELGADALVITDLTKSTRVKDRELSEVNKDIVFSYSAEAIRLCKNENKNLRRASSYDAQGGKGHTLKLSQIKTEFDMSLVIRQKPALQSLIDEQEINSAQFNTKPKLQNKNILLSGSIYGISLGATRQHVLETFGYPSAEFKLFKGIESLLYGRRHWLHFKQDKLISVEFTDQILSYDALNLIEANEEFDQFEWQIEQGIKVNSSIENIRDAFKNRPTTASGNLLTITQKNVQLSLVFDTEYDPFTKETKKYLVAFTLAYSDNKKTNAELSNTSLVGIDDIIKAAQSGQQPTMDTLTEKLPEPIGRIFSDQHSYYDIFDNHLMLKYRNKKMAELNMREDIFKKSRIKSPKGPWKLSDYLYQGAVAETFKPYFEHDFTIMLGKANMRFPHMQIRFYMDGDDEYAGLYAIDLIF